MNKVTYWKYLGDNDKFDKYVRIPAGYAVPTNKEYFTEVTYEEWVHWIENVKLDQSRSNIEKEMIRRFSERDESEGYY